jgi:pyruvate formate lyase activating enzyme
VVEIKGLEKFSPRDFPGHISSTLFLGGCNFRCPFCHNSDLVLHPEKLSSFPLDHFLNFLEKRKGWQEGICVSGGEPLIHDDIKLLLRLIKEKNLKIKLDTNGSFPKRLDELLSDKLIDIVAMDVKAPYEKYQEACGVAVDTDLIKASINIIINSGVQYVFRTTMVPGLVGKEDIKKIGEMLEGAEVFHIQPFVPENTLDETYMEKESYPQAEMEVFAEIARSFFPKVILEGL